MGLRHVLVVVGCLGAALAETATPLSKVLDLLNKELAKGKANMQAEKVEYAKEETLCTESTADLTGNIQKADDQIASLTADIQEATADSAAAAEESAELSAKVEAAEKDNQEATAIRKKEAEDFSALRTDYEESLDAIGRAIKALKARSKDVPEAAASLAQLKSSRRIPEHAKVLIESFLSFNDDKPAFKEDVNAYEFQSGGVVDMLAGLQKKFQVELDKAASAELNQKHNHQRFIQSNSDQIATWNDDISKKTQTKAQRDKDASDAKGELSSTTASKASDSKLLETTKSQCAASKANYEENQKTRTEELGAITKALEILQSDEVQGNADKHLPKDLALVEGAAALAHLRGESDSPMRQRVVDFLQGRAKTLGSQYLSLVAVRASGDAFGKVKKLIQELIWKLQEEANKEADKKGFCDAELATNKQTREEKSATVEKLQAAEEQLAATIQKLSQEITELSDSVAETQKVQAEKTQQRQEEKAVNTQTVADAKEGQLGVARAIQVLKNFYGNSQESSGGDYSGSNVAGGNIISMLEVCESDFARLETETSSNEAAAQSAYDKYMDETQQDIAVKQTEMEHKSNSKRRAGEKKTQAQKERSETQKELDAALKYYDELKPDCEEHNLSYDDRVAAREQEIASLREALQMLESDA